MKGHVKYGIKNVGREKYYYDFIKKVTGMDIRHTYLDHNKYYNHPTISITKPTNIIGDNDVFLTKMNYIPNKNKTFIMLSDAVYISKDYKWKMTNCIIVYDGFVTYDDINNSPTISNIVGNMKIKAFKEEA
ncbi:MAG: hypothetical protein IKR19_08030 [Acholeplasmatales bacterium]|nr:hypothetical protein [Acholeplasmatales bacterium]